jgi:hypothetical protein
MLYYILSFYTDIKVLQLLLNKGADVNVTDVDRNTLLTFYLSKL